MTEITGELMGTVISTALRTHMDNTPRSRQAQQGRLGASDLGFCRNKAALKQRRVTPSDSKRIMPLMLGNALHAHILGILGEMFPTWLIEKVHVTATLPSGRQVPGTPDIIVPEWNCLADLKGVDGFSWVKRTGVSENYAFQRHCYLLGALEKGYLDKDRPILLAEVYVDRSGAEDQVYVITDEPDWTLTAKIDSWLDEVDQATRTHSDAPRDIAAPVCERICEYFTVCRGGLPMREDEEITDASLLEAVQMHLDAGEKEREAKKMKDAAKIVLNGVNGSTPTHTVRWTEVGESSVEYKRDSYMRLDIRKRRT